MEDILIKILKQSEFIGIQGLIELSQIEAKDQIVERLKSHYSWVECLWENNFQEHKRNMALELKLMAKDEELRVLRGELFKLNKLHESLNEN